MKPLISGISIVFEVFSLCSANDPKNMKTTLFVRGKK